MGHKPANAPSTKQRLIDSALAILCTEGWAALSTVRLANEAGIVQSGFYRHFPSVEACVAEALRPVSAFFRTDIATRRRAWFDGDTDEASAIRHYVENLAIVTANPVLAEIAVKRRFEASPVGEQMRAFADGLVADMTLDLVRARAKRGQQRDRKGAEVAAHLILGAVYGGIELVLKGAPPAVVARGLALVGDVLGQAPPHAAAPPPRARAGAQRKRGRT